MNNIKMSDAFDLPVSIDKYMSMKDGADSFVHVASFDMLEKAYRAKVAINAYDANQERIAELEAMLQEVIYHFESGNGDHSNLNDGMIPKLKELAAIGDNNETT